MPTCHCGCGAQPAPSSRYLPGHWSRTAAAKAMYQERRSRITESDGLCKCGCGQKTPLATSNHAERGYRLGQPVAYLLGHQLKGKRGKDANAWKGGRWLHATGYIMIYAPDHPAATMDGYVPEHRLVMEKMLGRQIGRDEHVHHINGVKGDNRPENLEVLAHAEHTRTHSAQWLVAYAKDPANREARRAAGRKGAEARWGKRS